MSKTQNWRTGRNINLEGSFIRHSSVFQDVFILVDDFLLWEFVLSQEFNEVAAVQIISVHNRTEGVCLHSGKRWVPVLLFSGVLFPQNR